VIAGVLTSAIAAFFYIRVIIMIFFTDPVNDSVSVVIPTVKSRISIAVATLITLILGVFPSIVLDVANNFSNLIK
jgi:NADH-quinone oxidoreductase subunit N